MKTLSAEPPRPLPGNDDFLGNALHHLRMQTALYCRSELTAPWSIDMPVMENILMIHVVLSGQFWLEMEGWNRSYFGQDSLRSLRMDMGTG